MSATHYIGMSGLHGYLPNYTCLTDTVRAAVDDLDSLHELTKAQRASLRKYHSVELTQEQGAEYAEIHTCTCGTPEVHEEG